MKRIIFQSTKKIEPVLVNRTDIALFVGFVQTRNNPLPASIANWLTDNGFSTDQSLLNVPVPVSSWEEFDSLFLWDERDSGLALSSRDTVSMETYIGSSVRAFFSQGGRQCYVVSVGAPVLYNETRLNRLDEIKKLLPGYPSLLDVHVSDRNSWKGIGLLHALPEVSFVSLPDLPELVSSEPVIPVIEAPVIEQPPEQFVECSEPASLLERDDLSDYIRAPRCNDDAYQDWNNAIVTVIGLLRNSTLGRATHLVAAVPLPVEGSEADKNLADFFLKQKFIALSASDNSKNFSSAFLQLVYPWLVNEKISLPENLDNPEGALVGILANNALSRNTFRTVSNHAALHVTKVYPPLRQDQIFKEFQDSSVYYNRAFSLADRITLFYSTFTGVRLITDVSTSLDLQYQSAGVCRLVSLLVRACRMLGEELIFESSGENLWATIENRLNQYLQTLYSKGAFSGKNAKESFDVKCYRSTMTQNQIDKGIVIAHVRFEAAVSIESINISLSLTGNGQVDIESTDSEKAA